jgi:Mg-chelatase subunit ChlD
MWANHVKYVGLIVLLLAQSAWSEGLNIRQIYAKPSGLVSILANIPEPSTEERARASEEKAKALQERAKYFRLVEDGEVTVTASSLEPFEESRWKLALVVCVDASGSMAGKPLVEAKQALKKVLNKKFPESVFANRVRIAIISFENRVRTMRWFEVRQEELQRVMDQVNYRGGQDTLLYDALYHGLESLQPDALFEHKRILVITDGKDEGSQKSGADVVKKARELGVPIDVVARVRKDRFAEEREEGFVQDLRPLAAKTLGEFRQAKPGAVYKELEEILNGALSTKVLNFRRTRDNIEARETQTVGLESSEGGKIALARPVAASIPRTRPMEPPPLWRRALERWRNQLWGVLAGLLVVFSVLLLRRRKRRAAALEKSVQAKKTAHRPQVKIPQKREPRESKTPEPSKAVRPTVVGGAHCSAPTAERPAGVLMGVGGPGKGLRIALGKRVVRIGTSRDNEVIISGDDYVSGHHASIRYEEGDLLLVDEHSTNGTFLNDERVRASGSRIKPGDRIRVGLSAFEVVQSAGDN